MVVSWWRTSGREVGWLAKVGWVGAKVGEGGGGISF